MPVKPLPPELFVDHGTNAEMRWDSADLTDGLTDQARLFVRSHTTAPDLDPVTYRLRVFGDGLAPRRVADDALELSLDDLDALPQVSRPVLLECTGNGRRLFGDQQGTPIEETPWRMGAVGVVEATGVLVRDVLESIGLAADAREVLATGLDDAYVRDGVDHGPVRRPYPLTERDALLVRAFNGEDLLPDHGYPLRLLVPGWVGIAQVKWLGSLEVSTGPLESPWNTRWYRMSGGDHPADSPPLTVLPVRSALALPWPGQVQVGEEVELTGRAWSGLAPIRRVEVSTDDGATWTEAELVPDDAAEVWSRFQSVWRPGAPGEHAVLVRATDGAGRTQPDRTPYNSDGYLFDAVVRHPVVVTG